MKSRKLRQKQKGQSLLEFALATFGFFSVLFIYVKLSLTLSISHFVQYATYMSARAFFSGAETMTSQENAARQVLTQTLKRGGNDRFQSVLQGVGDGDPAGAFIGRSSRVPGPGRDGARTRSWEQGVTYKFKAKLQLVPLPGSGRAKSLELESQSWLGREVTQEECINYIQNKNAVIDNGC